jgi:hypothetical protein
LLIFHPEADFHLEDLGDTAAGRFQRSAPYRFPVAEKLGRRQMLLRKIIHMVLLASILLNFASLWDWSR